MPGKGKPFEKGHTLSVGKGRPPMEADLKKVKRISKERVEKVMAKFADMDREEIRALMSDPKTPMLELMVGSVVLKAFKHGDQQRINFILDRTIGKVKEVREITLPQPTIVERFEANQPVLELGAELVTGDDDDQS